MEVAPIGTEGIIGGAEGLRTKCASGLNLILYDVFCNRLHNQEASCAPRLRLLMTHDRAGQDRIPLTREFLTHMLGARRGTVNPATGMLSKASLISYARGKEQDRPSTRFGIAGLRLLSGGFISRYRRPKPIRHGCWCFAG